MQREEYCSNQRSNFDTSRPSMIIIDPTSVMKRSEYLHQSNATRDPRLDTENSVYFSSLSPYLHVDKRPPSVLHLVDNKPSHGLWYVNQNLFIRLKHLPSFLAHACDNLHVDEGTSEWRQVRVR